MKDQLKQIAIALCAIAAGAALLTAGYLFYTRPLSLSAILPQARQGLECQVVLMRPDGAEVGAPFDLEPQQIQQLLDRLEESAYSRPLSALTDRLTNSVTGVSVTIDPYARIYFTQQDLGRGELMLCGELLVVNCLGSTAGKDGRYHVLAGTQSQQDIVDWLSDIQNDK